MVYADEAAFHFECRDDVFSIFQQDIVVIGQKCPIISILMLVERVVPGPAGRGKATFQSNKSFCSVVCPASAQISGFVVLPPDLTLAEDDDEDGAQVSISASYIT
ncbi:hypothetical protein J6590_019390 [Homalodisca vitripennis]|nr:hypothetical protein J6590_019390 [Homalodisca vitripennis]